MGKWLTGLLILAFTCQVSAQDRDLSFFNIFDGTFSSASVNHLNWMQDGQFYTRAVRLNSGVEIRKFDILTEAFEVIVTSEQLRQQYPEAGQIADYHFSENEQFLLIKTDIEPTSRKENLNLIETDIEPLWKSYRANHYIYDRVRDRFLKLGVSGDKQQYAEISPTGTHAAFVQDNNLYWMDLNTEEIGRITTDGEADKIINGAADWVYEEEFGVSKGWFWSPDGARIAFYRVNESEVQDFRLTEWNGSYPGEVYFKYPKAGDKNADIDIGIFSLNTGETVWAEIPDHVEYIPRINWTFEENTLAIRTLNRLQNHLQLYLVNADDGEASLFWEMTDEAWIDIDDNFEFISDDHSFLYTSDKNGFTHLYLWDSELNQSHQLTQGDWEVTEFIGYDWNDGWVYFTGNESTPIEQHIYRVNINGSQREQLSSTSGWNQADMSPDFQYFIHSHSSIDSPPAYTLRSADGSEIRSLEKNNNTNRVLDIFRLPDFEFMTLDIEGTGELNALMFKPNDFDPDKKYPLIVYVYGGPGSQTVTNSFRLGHKNLWHYYLVSKGYLVVTVDNRGTGGRGRDFSKQIHGKLGQYETMDQVEAARYFSELEYIDPDRIGIWGWSYGGYLSSLALAEGNDVFSLGIAVAPVTHWRYYNTIFSERYLKTPELNQEGYEVGAPVNRADEIIGHYLLIHGTADEYVHFQNAVDMVDALVRHNVQFQTMFYPNRNHSIRGGNTRLHLFRMMTDFIQQNL
jgi:dipeptidyl-peptidase 4